MARKKKGKTELKKILFVGSECMPFAATGGLGDVMGSLPAALKKAGGSGIDARVVMPLYDRIGNDWRSRMQCEAVFEVYLGWRRQYCGVHSLEKDLSLIHISEPTRR